MMSTANEYRLYAEQCVRSAQDAPTLEDKATHLHVAQMWTSAALHLEGGNMGTVRTPRDRADLDRFVPQYSTRWRMY